MRRALVFLFLGGCAHAPGPLAHRAHAPLTLLPIQGLDSGRASVLEDAICEGLVQANHGDVSCPSSVEAVLGVQRQRALLTGQTAAARAAADKVMAVGENVRCSATQTAKGWSLTMSYSPSPKAKVLAQKRFTASSFDALVRQAPADARSLFE